MAGRNWPNCVVCGKKERIMKRCGRCKSIFYCSIECQRFDWTKHKDNCTIKNQEKKLGDKMAAASATTGLNKVADSKLQSLERNKNAGLSAMTVDMKNSLINVQINQIENKDSIKSNCIAVTGAAINVYDSCDGFKSEEKEGRKHRSFELLNTAKGEDCNASLHRSHDIKASVLENRETEIIKRTDERHELSGNNYTPDKESNERINVQNDSSNFHVYAQYAKEKHKVDIILPCTGFQALECFSRVLHVPLERLKLIHKGKLQTESTIMGSLHPNSTFLAFGEKAESEDGLDADDIERIMKQLSVGRNVAIKALRKTSCLVDAIFEIANDM